MQCVMKSSDVQGVCTDFMASLAGNGSSAKPMSSSGLSQASSNGVGEAKARHDRLPKVGAQ